MFWNKRKSECNHEWKVIASVIARPVSVNAKLLTEATLARITLGETNMVLTCVKCGKLDKSTVSGVPE